MVGISVGGHGILHQPLSKIQGFMRVDFAMPALKKLSYSHSKK